MPSSSSFKNIRRLLFSYIIPTLIVILLSARSLSDLNDLLAMRNSVDGVVGTSTFGNVFASSSVSRNAGSALSLLSGSAPLSPYDPAWWRNHPTPGTPQYERWTKQTQLSLRAAFGLPAEEKADEVVPGPEIFRKHLHTEVYELVSFQKIMVNVSITMFGSVYYMQPGAGKVRLGRFDKWLKDEQGREYAMQYLWGDLCIGFGQRNVTVKIACHHTTIPTNTLIEDDKKQDKVIIELESQVKKDITGNTLTVLENSFIEYLKRPCNYEITLTHKDACTLGLYIKPI
jgi:hypothetical protein